MKKLTKTQAKTLTLLRDELASFYGAHCYLEYSMNTLLDLAKRTGDVESCRTIQKAMRSNVQRRKTVFKQMADVTSRIFTSGFSEYGEY